MIGLSVKTKDDTKRVEQSIERATFRNMGHASAAISRSAKESLVKADGPSEPGSPPHTHQGQFMRRSVRFDVNRREQSAMIGPLASIVGQAGAAHEFGEVFRGTDYPERPFMGPALEKNLDRFAADWAGSIGE